MEKPRVLVVEDRPSVLKLVATVLEGAYDVSTAADGAKALSMIGEAPIDVVLTDVRMPGASGFEVLWAVQRQAPGTAVVLMTAYANIPDAVEAMRQGAADYVAKPLDADEIALVVARAVDQRRQETPRRLEGTGGSAAPRTGSAPLQLGFHRAIEEIREAASREYLESLMEAFHGNVTQAAKRAGMTRESLHRVLRRYGVRCDDYRGEAEGGCPDGHRRAEFP